MSSPPATDPDLVRGLQAGRRDAFERLYGEYQAPIYNLCARVLGDREEAKDVTQEVFIKAFHQLPETDAESFALRPWLYRVATNACFNTLRSRRKLGGGGDAGLEQAASGIDEFERAQTVALVEQSLGAMNERYRTALVLKDLQGLPPEEIAAVMDVSRANADVLVHRARASFKTVFAKLAGSDAAAPAALGLVLLPLSVPAALQAMPPLPAHLAPVHAPLHPGIPATAGPAGAGLLTKIGAALTTKAAIAAAATALIIGGGVVAVKEAERDHPAPAAAAASTTRT
ncbi:MAG TPA: sigma-70 family RNA polymerase sigma factor, partial [Thermoleophilia bacterium]